jgi:uncharacterized protein YfcZ (UPF0381/DUF406 family)
MNLFSPKKESESLTEACFSASSANNASKEYKRLVKEKMDLQDKLRKLSASGKGNTSEAERISKKIDSIDAKLNGS